MARSKLIIGEMEIDTTANRPKWQQTHGMYLAGRAAIDEADLITAQMEREWGAGRLRLLVPAELREKFDRQRYLLNQAIWHGDLEDVRNHSRRMVAAYKALDAAAKAAGQTKPSPDVWEVVLENGAVAVIVRDNLDAAHVHDHSDRAVCVYTLEEIARLISGFPAIVKAKEVWMGAAVEAVRTTHDTDPLGSIEDTSVGLDDPLPF